MLSLHHVHKAHFVSPLYSNQAHQTAISMDTAAQVKMMWMKTHLSFNLRLALSWKILSHQKHAVALSRRALLLAVSSLFPCLSLINPLHCGPPPPPPPLCSIGDCCLCSLLQMLHQPTQLHPSPLQRSRSHLEELCSHLPQPWSSLVPVHPAHPSGCTLLPGCGRESEGCQSGLCQSGLCSTFSLFVLQRD